MNYCRSITFLLALTSFWTLASVAASVTMNKCMHPDGRFEFTDRPCPSNALSSSIENKMHPQESSSSKNNITYMAPLRIRKRPDAISIAPKQQNSQQISSINKVDSNITGGVELPKKVADYFIQTTGNWKNGNPFEGEVSVTNISPNIYRVDYNFQQPIAIDSSAAMIPILNECLANYIADKTHSPGWDVGQEKDLYDRNFGKPFSKLSYLILTGAKDGETREHATGRKTMFWKYGEFLDRKSFQYQDGYSIGDCMKLLKPEFTKHTPVDMAIEPIKKTNRGLDGGLLNLVKPEYSSGEASLGYEARISVKLIGSNFYSVTYSYPELVDTSKEGAAMYYSLAQSALTMCIGGYLAGKQGYDVWDVGMGKFLNQVGSKDGLNSFDYFVLVNPKDGVSRVAATGRNNIRWMGESSDYQTLKSVNKSNLVMFQKLLRPEYVPK